MLYHTHITCVEDKRSLFVFEYLVELVGALFLHKVVPPAAGLSAFAAVGVSSRKILGNETASRKAHTHRAVYESFYLHIIGDILPYRPYVFKVDLASQYNAANSHFIQLERRSIVDYARLRRRMYRKAWSVLLNHRDDPDIRRDDRVHSAFFRGAYKLGKALGFVVGGDGVAGNVDLYASFVRGLHSSEQLLSAEVLRSRSHSERLARKVDRVRAVVQRRQQAFLIARGSKKFRFNIMILHFAEPLTVPHKQYSHCDPPVCAPRRTRRCCLPQNNNNQYPRDKARRLSRPDRDCR